MSRYFQILIGIVGWLLLLATVEYLPAPRKTVFWDRLFDTGHILIFGFGVLSCLVIACAAMGGQAVRLQYVASLVTTAVLGIVLEVWQSTRGRTAEWIDVYSDFIGILAFAAVYAARDQRIRAPRVWWLRPRSLLIVAALSLLLGVMPFFQTVRLYQQRTAIVPQLVDWTLPWANQFYYARSSRFEVVPPPEDWPKAAKQKQTPTSPKSNSGRHIAIPGLFSTNLIGDWSNFQAIEIDVLLDSHAPREFLFRFQDANHNGEYEDRFNREFPLEPGFQTLRFPVAGYRSISGRALDLADIASFAFFTRQPNAPLTIYVGQIRLVP